MDVTECEVAARAQPWEILLPGAPAWSRQFNLKNVQPLAFAPISWRCACAIRMRVRRCVGLKRADHHHLPAMLEGVCGTLGSDVSFWLVSWLWRAQGQLRTGRRYGSREDSGETAEHADERTDGRVVVHRSCFADRCPNRLWDLRE